VSVMKREICQRMKGSWNDDMGMTEVSKYGSSLFTYSLNMAPHLFIC